MAESSTKGPPARVDDLDLDVARWLVLEGTAVVAAVVAQLDAGGDDLRAATFLRDGGVAGPRARAALDAAKARRRARGVWPDADRLLFTQAALEQASDPRVAAHRATRFTGRELVLDLCCGVGGDALALAGAGATVLAVDRSAARVLLCRHNATTLGADVHAVVGDALAPPAARDVTVHVDPGRRPDGHRAHWLRDHEPPVAELADVVAARTGGGIVLSPAVSLSDPDLPGGELEFVQVGRQLVEACCWLGELRTERAVATATILGQDGELTSTWTREGAVADIGVAEVGAWLVEPAPALVRARLHHEHGLALDGWRIAGNRALLSTDRDPGPSPWHTAWRVEEVVAGRPRAVADALRALEPAPLSISLHGDVRPVELWWKALKGQPRGPIGRRIHVVAGDDGVMAVISRPAG